MKKTTAEAFKRLLADKALFEAHPENPTLQERELSIIAHQILTLEGDFSNPPTAEEKSALEWANRYLATV